MLPLTHRLILDLWPVAHCLGCTENAGYDCHTVERQCYIGATPYSSVLFYAFPDFAVVEWCRICPLPWHCLFWIQRGHMRQSKSGEVLLVMRCRCQSRPGQSLGVSPQRGRQASCQTVGSLGQAGSMQRVRTSMRGSSMQPRRRATLSLLPLCTISSKGRRAFCTQRYGTEVHHWRLGALRQLEAASSAM